MLITGTSINDLLYKGINALFDHGEEVVVKNNTTLELHPCMLILNDARKRTLIYPHRGNNPFSTLFETLWVLSGRNDIKHLEFFLPRAGDFTDAEDSSVWRAGYGKRIFYHLGIDSSRASGTVHNSATPSTWEIIPHKPVDQFKYVYETLKADPNSRQAVMTIWDPAKECTVGKSKDFPCCNHIVFLIRNGALDCTLTIRSNDVLWGFSSINLYEFTVMQEIMANMLGVKVGKYIHVANSFHCYVEGGFNAEANFKKLKKCADNVAPAWLNKLEPETFCAGWTYPAPDMYEDTMLKYRDIYINTCKMINVGEHQFHKEVQKRYDNPNLMCPLETYLYLYVIYKRKDKLARGCEALPHLDNFDTIYRHHMATLPMTDLKLSCHYWFMKQRKEIKTTELYLALVSCKELTEGE